MERTGLRRFSLSSTSSSTLISMKTKKTTPTTSGKEWKEETERKRWDWLDLSASPRRSTSSDSEDGHSGSSSDGRQAEEEEEEGGEEHDDQADGTGWGAGYEERGDAVYAHPPADWSPPPIHHPDHHRRNGSALRLDHIGQHSGSGGPEENLLLGRVPSHRYLGLYPHHGMDDDGAHGEGDVLNFCQSKKRTTNIQTNNKASFSTLVTRSPPLTRSPTTTAAGFPRPSPYPHHQPLGRFKANHNSGRNGHHTRALTTVGGSGVQPEPNFVSSNIYLRPLPSTFTPLDLHELCMSMVRRPATSSSSEPCKLLTGLDPRSNQQDIQKHLGDDHHLLKLHPSSSSSSSSINDDNDISPSKNDQFRILSVKVMIEEEDQASLGSCKGFGFCLWNSVEASTRCIEGLRAHGYQASYARESSRGMLASLADPTSANIYLSNLPFHWGEEDVKALFGNTPIASARLLRDRDDEAVGSGASRGVGFVRLSSRADALHFVELLHGMPIPGTKCHLQCRMADSQAQKEWKRNVRSSFKQQLTLEPSAPAALPPSVQEGWNNRDGIAGGPTGTPKLKWRNKKVAQKSHSTPANYMIGTPSDRRRANTARSFQPSRSGPGFELGAGGFHVVGLGSAGGGFLMPGFHPAHSGSPLAGGGLHSARMLTSGNSGVAPSALPGAPPTGAYGDPALQPLFPLGPATPLLPFYPPGGWPGLNFSPGSDTSPTSSVASPATPAKFPATNWPGPATAEFFEKSTAYYYYHHHELYQPIPNHHLPHQPQPLPHHNESLGLVGNPPGSTGLNDQNSPLDGPTQGATTIEEFYSTETQTVNSAPIIPGLFQPVLDTFDHHQQHPLQDQQQSQQQQQETHNHENKFLEISPI
ncbi:hypothetical protein PGT21_020161 [Puccinia graminis f. sp. tritici]|uniref:RRM domain-containing protein n=1 Tax=Puccinia graminis f. sp. tritici TaxID=56615 RepID=A0A5B0QG43_PUCGR|nr:hypothetical protein PGT21_020161 [Puccinia graminis f. sp. tritici]KAA1112158.1 hypothetical protein PGTUg99_012322 [Puccinia graminis f. sp. tritici]